MVLNTLNKQGSAAVSLSRWTRATCSSVCCTKAMEVICPWLLWPAANRKLLIWTGFAGIGGQVQVGDSLRLGSGHIGAKKHGPHVLHCRLPAHNPKSSDLYMAALKCRGKRLCLAVFRLPHKAYACT